MPIFLPRGLPNVSRELSYPKWVPPEVIEEAQHLSEQEACNALGPWATLPDKAASRQDEYDE